MKPVVLVGKGPSAQHVPASDDYVVAAVNNATMFCEKVDYLFIQDLEILEAMGPEDYSKANMAVVPTHPYREHCQYKHLTHLEMLKYMVDFTVFHLSASVRESRHTLVEGTSIFPISTVERCSCGVAFGPRLP